MNKPLKVLDFVRNQNWCIEPSWLKAIHAVVNREGLEALMIQGVLPEAISSKMGKPLDNSRSASVRGNVAIIPIQGVITPRASMFQNLSGGVSSETILRDFTTAMEDPSISAILLQVDSPGGAVTGISDVADAIFNARNTKTIYTHVVGDMSSAALWIGTSASKVFASPTAVIGSIGTVATIDTSTEENTLEIVSTQSPKKRMDMTTTEGQTELLKILDAISSTFIGSVARNRDTTEEDVQNNFGQGGVFIASEAEKVGIIDGIASFEDTLAMIQGSKRTQTTTSKRINAMTITKELIEAEHKTIADAFRAEGVVDAVKADRERSAKIFATAPKGSEDLALKAVTEGISAGDFALQILEAQNKKLEKIDASAKADSAPLATIGAQAVASENVDADAEERAKIAASMKKRMQA